MKEISVIIANHNTVNVLRSCMQNLFEYRKFLQIIVVDNGSTDGSVDLLKKEFKFVEVIAQDNLGISVAYNNAFQLAKHDYILYLGTDAFPKKEDLESLLKILDLKKEFGALTASLVLADGSIDMDAHRGFPTPWASLTHFSGLDRLFPKSKIFNQYLMGYKDMTKTHEINLCISHFLLVKRKVVEELNGWDEDFFVFGEDVDFCYRLAQKGYKLLYVPSVKVSHLKGVSVGTRKTTNKISTASKETKLRMKKMSTYAMKLFYKKHLDKKYPFVVNQLVYFGIYLMEKLRTFRL